MKKGSKLQDSTLFDHTKLGFYPVENAVETVNNYWMLTKSARVMETIFTICIHKIYNFYCKNEEGGGAENVTSGDETTGAEFFSADGGL